jgi:hypothetical protein
MKVTLEYDGTEEQDDLKTALDGYKWKSVVWDIDQLLRKTTRYQVSLIPNTETATGIEMDIADHVRDALRKILNDYNLNLD